MIGWVVNDREGDASSVSCLIHACVTRRARRRAGCYSRGYVQRRSVREGRRRQKLVVKATHCASQMGSLRPTLKQLVGYSGSHQSR